MPFIPQTSIFNLINRQFVMERSSLPLDLLSLTTKCRKLKGAYENPIPEPAIF